MWMTLNSQCLHIYWKWKGKNEKGPNSPRCCATFIDLLCVSGVFHKQIGTLKQTQFNGKRYQKHDWIVSRAVWRYVGLRLYMTSFMTIWKRVPSETLRLWMRSLKTVLLWGHLAEICNSHNNKSHFLNPNKNTYVSMYDLCRVGWKLSEEEEFGQTWRTDSEN